MVSLLDVTVLLLCIAVSGLHVLDYLLASISPRNPAGAVALLALPTAYFTGVILVYLQIAPAPPPPAPVSPVALRLLAAMACVLILLAAIIMPLAPWLFSM